MFQILWAVKLQCIEGVIATDGILYMVRCKVYSTLDRKLCIMAPKFNMFKHSGKRTTKKNMLQYKVKARESYIATQCKHRKNLHLYAAKPPSPMLEQLNNCTTLEARKMRVQFGKFHLLSDDCPMTKFESY